MSQMQPYCFKCGAQLEPEATQCPACGRVQRSMLVRSAGPGGPQPPPHERGDGGRRPVQPGRGRPPTLAIAGLGALGLVLAVLLLGRVCSGGAGPVARQAATAPVVDAVPSDQAVPGAAPSPAPATTPSPAARPTASPGTPSAAVFTRVGADIPGKCSTAQGCPVTGTFKNTGGAGGGTVTFSLLDDSGNVVGTLTTAIPVTDAGATVDVSGYATGDQLAAYLKSGGTVHLQVQLQNG